MSRLPKTRKAIMLDSLFYGIVILVLSFVIPFKQEFFDKFGGRPNFIIWSVAAYAFGLLTIKIFRDYRSGRK
jgi:hypothetical protein